MPMIDFLCDSCGLHFDHYFKGSDVIPEESPCDCGASAKRTAAAAYTMRRPVNLNAQSFDPVVIHRDAEGNISFPGNSNAPIPPGFEKVELRTVREVRALEREMNTRERARAEEHIMREESAFRAGREERRSELASAMVRMSPYGRDFARHVMKAMDERRHQRRHIPDPGFFVEAFSQDSSNREAHFDASTGWQRRKG